MPFDFVRVVARNPLAAALNCPLTAFTACPPEAAQVKMRPVEIPATRYAKTDDDVHIAYSSVGEGPDLIFIPGFVSNVELLWEDADASRFQPSRTFRSRHHP